MGDSAKSGDTRPRRPTIKDVARHAGVSTGLVSMALADHPAVAPTTKETIRRAASDLGYAPNSLGRALRAQQLGSIAVVIPHSSQHVFSHPYFIKVLEGVTEVANAHDLTVVISMSREEEDQEAAYLKILRSRRVDGVIVAAAAIADTNVDRLVTSGYPVVYLGRDVRHPAVTSVVIDDRGGAEGIVTHLLEIHGLRRIAHIAGPLGHRSAVDKLDGYRAALVLHGLAADDRLVVEADYSEAGGARACQALLESGQKLDAIFAANDQMAFGALQTLRQRGIDVPGSVAIAGYDDIDLAGLLLPPLTTVHQPMAEIGRQAAERLIALLAGQTPEPGQLELPVELVIRHSCGC